MKLMRYGAKGSERPGLIDAQGKVRSLSGVMADLGRRRAVAGEPGQAAWHRSGDAAGGGAPGASRRRGAVAASSCASA